MVAGVELAHKSDAGSVEPILDMHDVQGNVFPGFAKDHVTVLGFRLGPLPQARAALSVLADEVATAAEVWAFGQLFAATRRRRGHEFALQSCWSNVALSFRALLALTPDADQFLDSEFRAGVDADSATPTDLLLIVAADQRGAVERESARLAAALVPGFVPIDEHRGDALPGSLRGFEHFGFRDGISQPGVRGRHPEPPHPPVTTRLNSVRPDQGTPGQDLIWPGEFIFGYPGEGEATQPGPVSTAGPQWADHGSFLVFGRYRQDVAAFQRFTREAAETLRRTVHGLVGLTDERMAAWVVGRWPSGAPLVRSPLRDNPELGADDLAANDFVYRSEQPSPPVEHAPADPDGIRCPYPAHIRKANVRDDLTGRGQADQSRHHRMLRRGIPYGPPGSDHRDRGLLFLSYQTSIVRQFSFVRENWMDNDHLRVPHEGIDLILGTSPSDTRTFGVSLRDGADVRIVPVPAAEPFTELDEAGYYFSPGVAGLRQLAAMSYPPRETHR